MSYGATNVILEWCKRRFGGVTPDQLIDTVSMGELDAIASPKKRLFHWLVVPCLIAAYVGATWAAVALCRHLDGPLANPILDERSRFLWLGFPVFFGMGFLWLGCVLELLVLPRMVRWDVDLWNRYYGTKHGWLPRRSMMFLAALFLPMLAVLLPLSFNIGDRVDESGMAFLGHPFKRHKQQYSAVASIEMYSAWKGPLGVRHRPNLVVRFASGVEWEYAPEPGGWADPADVADYIAVRSGKPVQNLGMRP